MHPFGLQSFPLHPGSANEPWRLSGLSYEGRVLVIGAGAAGLYAAWLLQQLGVQVTVLEAAQQPGGRIQTLEGFASFPLDMGAEWLHGEDSVLFDWVEASGHEIYEDVSQPLLWLDRQLKTSSPPADREASRLMKSMQTLDWEAMEDISLLDWFEQEGYSPRLRGLLDYLASELGTSPSRLGIKGYAASSEFWSSGDRDFKFIDSFQQFFARQIVPAIEKRILCDMQVHQIDYSQEKIKVIARSKSLMNEQIELTADKVLLTIPITQFQKNKIQFSPALPDEKQQAIQKIGMDAAMKIFLKFKKRFWNQEIIGTQIANSYYEPRYAEKEFVLAAYLMGEKAQYLSQLPDKKAIALLLDELDVIFNKQASRNYMASYIIDWSVVPFIEGGYSYSRPGMGDARKVLAQTLDNKIFFAGEATNYHGHHQTVHGAMESAYREVLKIVNT